MARGRSANYEDQREMILDRAGELFARGGYPGTSMNQVAEACKLSKATLYHYYRDKYALLVTIADEHVSRLQNLVMEIEAQPLSAEVRLRQLIFRFVETYASAQAAHRVLTQDVKFLKPADQDRVLEKERRVVAGFARVLAQFRPEMDEAELAKPLTMLLFGMINWMFTWMKPAGAMTHQAMAPIVADLFLGGILAIKVPVAAPP